MSKLLTKGIVTIAGTIVAFVLMNSSLIRLLAFHPVGKYFSDYVFSYLIIAVLALLYGPVVGGAVGLFSWLIHYFNINYIYLFIYLYKSPYNIFQILFTGFYGFIIGKIFESKTIKKDSKNAVGNIGFFSLLITGLIIIKKIITFFYLFRSSQETLNQQILMYYLICGLIIGAISFVIIFICHKCLKIDIPIYAKEEKTSVKSEESISYSAQDETSTESKIDSGKRVVIAKSSRSRLAAALLCFFFGALGIHRFYVGKVGTGLLWFFTLGLGGIGVIVDFILIIVGAFKDKEGINL